MTVFNPGHKPYQMFLGGDLGVQDYINPKYPIFKKLADIQIDQRWRETETSHQIDRLQMAQFTDVERHIFNHNFSFQILADSIQGRGPAIFMLASSAPEVELCIGEWLSSEQLHSRTYTHIIRSIYDDPSVVLNPIGSSMQLLERTQYLVDAYDEFAKLFYAHKAGYKVNQVELKRSLMKAVIATNVLESIKFYGSFAPTFGFAEMKKLEGVAKQLQFIARDENMHTAITQGIIKNWATGVDGDIWVDLWNELKPLATKMYIDQVQVEKDNAEVLFQHGTPLLGQNAKVLGQYVEYMANKRMVNIGLNPVFATTKDPLPWIQRNWLGDKQVAPQETEKTDYRTGNIHKDAELATIRFSGF